MLDFYYMNTLDDSQEYPDETKYIGEIGFEDFKLLEELVDYSNSLGICLNYYSDTKVIYSNTVKIFHFAENQLKNTKHRKKTAYLKIMKILNKAIMRNSGIESYCD